MTTIGSDKLTGRDALEKSHGDEATTPFAAAATSRVVFLSNRGDLRTECLARCLSAILGYPFTMHDDTDAVVAALGREGTGLVIVSDFDDDVRARHVLQQLGPLAPVVVFSARDDIADVLESLRNGARAHVLLNSPLDAAVEALRTVVAGGIYVPPAKDLSQRKVKSAAPLPYQALLTERQLEVARALAKGTPNKVIANDLRMSESTVKIHIYNIMRKLEARNRTEVALRFALAEAGGATGDKIASV